VTGKRLGVTTFNYKGIAHIIKECMTCQCGKTQKHRHIRVLIPQEASTGICHNISIFIAGKTPNSNKSYMVVIVDRYSRFVWATAKRNMPSTQEILQSTQDNLAKKKAAAKSIMMDHSRQFSSKCRRQTLLETGKEAEIRSLNHSEVD
jgi:hypothetical protein